MRKSIISDPENLHDFVAQVLDHLGGAKNGVSSSYSLTQSALARIFQQELDDLAQAFEATLVWNKLSLVHLNVLLVGYLLPPRSIH
jgi:hypothetical protein